MAKLVARWVRFYTRRLPAPDARRRIGEIDADLHDQIAHERAHGTSDRRIALGIAARAVRGLGADLSYLPAVRIWLATAFVLLVVLGAMQVTDEVDWGAADFVLAGLVLGGSGMLLERAARKAGNTAHLVAATAIGVAAIALGQADDAPGLVLVGCLLILGTVALAVRTAQRSR
jgi:hypothetical protein